MQAALLSMAGSYSNWCSFTMLASYLIIMMTTIMMILILSQVVGIIPVVKGNKLVSNEAKIRRTVSTKFN